MRQLINVFLCICCDSSKKQEEEESNLTCFGALLEGTKRSFSKNVFNQTQNWNLFLSSLSFFWPLLVFLNNIITIIIICTNFEYFSLPLNVQNSRAQTTNEGDNVFQNSFNYFMNQVHSSYPKWSCLATHKYV